MRISRIAVIALAVAAAATGLACGGAGTPDGPTRPPVIVETTTTTKPATKPPVTSAPVETTKPTTPPAPPRSVSQRNADRSAASYLDGQSFSRKGLIEQLVYEGFTKTEATSAVDQLHADWNTQAVAHAKSYLEYQAFSKKSLIDQLEYDGFTPAQAKYGVSKSGL